MSRLRELLVELIGAEVQAHPVSIGGKSKVMHFRQFDDATGRVIFAVQDGETADERGLRIMKGVVANSVCNEAGELISTPEEVAALPNIALQALFGPAAATNNISTPAAGAAPDDADPGDEAASPNA